MYSEQDIAELYQTAKKKAEVEAIKSVVNQLLDAEEPSKAVCDCEECDCEKEKEKPYSPYNFTLYVNSVPYVVRVSPGPVYEVVAHNAGDNRRVEFLFDRYTVHTILRDLLNG